MEEIKELLKSIISMAVNNSKQADDAKEGEDEMQIENEKVDKRKLIDEVAGIMKSAGCDDEDIRTAIGKMEKIGYDKSEDDSADNKKVKNEVEEDEEKADNKCKNEDDKDEEKVEEVEEDVKEDVENKCKNSVDNSKTDFYNKMNEIYNAAQDVKETSVYVSRIDKLKAGDEMFRV